MTKKKAIQLAIKAMQKERQRFVVGHNAYLDGYRAHFAERNHKQYTELSDAITMVQNTNLADPRSVPSRDE
jgi:hypothetical protein